MKAKTDYKKVKSRIHSFRDPNSLIAKNLEAREEVEKINDVPSFSQNVGKKRRINNLYQIKV